jgi:hypothetical protein
MKNMTGKRLFLALGSCLLVQGAMLMNDFDAAAAGMRDEESTFTAPLYHHEHSSEVLGQNISETPHERPIEMTYYIHKRMFEMLPQRWRPKSASIARAVIETSNQYRLDPLFLMALIQHESRFNPEAVGGHGEIGLMQIKPSTAKWLLGYAPNDPAAPSDIEMVQMLNEPETNIAIGASYLALLRNRFEKNSDHYIAAYNMGSARVRTHVKGGVTPRIYKDRILKEYAQLTTGFSSLDWDALHPVRQIASLQFDALTHHSHAQGRNGLPTFVVQ